MILEDSAGPSQSPTLNPGPFVLLSSRVKAQSFRLEIATYYDRVRLQFGHVHQILLSSIANRNVPLDPFQSIFRSLKQNGCTVASTDSVASELD